MKQALARSLTIRRDYAAAGHEALGKWGYLCLGVELLERNPPNDLRKLIQHFSTSQPAKALGWLEFSAYCCPACASQTLQINRHLLNVVSKIDNLHHTRKALSNVSISSPQSPYLRQVTFSLPT